MSWPLAAMVIVVVLVIGVVALLDRDINAVSNTILMLLVALGLAELREIKSNTNGSNDSLMRQNQKLMDELAQYRRDAASFTNRALDAAPLPPTSLSGAASVHTPAPDPGDPDMTIILPPVAHRP